MPFDPRMPKPEEPTPPAPAFDGAPEPEAPPAPAAPAAPPAAPAPPPAAPPVPPQYAAPPVDPAPPTVLGPSDPPTFAAPAPPPSYDATPPPTNPYGQPPVVAQAAPQGFAAPAGPGAAGPPSFDPPASNPSSSGSGRGGRGALIAVGVVLIAAVAAIAGLVLTGGDDTDSDVAGPTTVPVATLPETSTSVVEEGSTTTVVEEDDTESSLPPSMTASVAELAESTVQILVLNGGVPVCSGSGTIIDDQGTILTNAHVIEPGGPCSYDSIGIAITTDAGRPPELLYLADVYAYDPVVDLAVVRISTDLDGAPAPGPFKSVPVGDSDAVEIGDQLRILGYPGIGGDTVTFTNGVVSGFASQNGIGDRSWIKTDATIAGGNSGGAGFDDDGQLVGVPTQASASSSGEVVDCRVITDTNGDGVTDGADQCVPIGGFLNGLRPVNLALPLIEQAATGSPISIQSETPTPAGSFDVSELSIFNPGWTLDASVEADFTPEFVRTAVAGAEKLCLWFDWSGLPDGVVWDGVWQVDGVVNEDFSFFSEEWAAGDAGENYWLCAIETTGLAAGLYEFIFYVEGDVIFYESFEITDTLRPVHEVTFVNNSGTRICYLYTAPLGVINTGLDELGLTEVFDVGTSKTIAIPEGSIVADAYDCDFNRIYEQYDGLAITGPTTVDITG